ncbi:MAG: CBS domain-containing protein [Anaerolineales bacterium]|nr:CBS domain-containing protein [Anaerolineales bacterium]
MTYMLVVILHDLSRLAALLEAWKHVGVPGVTLMRSAGGYQVENWLDRIGLGRLFEHEEVQQRMLISVIKDTELLERAISEADRVVGGFDRPHSGILFTLPVGHALGIRKRGQPADMERQPQAWEVDLLKLDRKTPVAQIINAIDLDPVKVQADASLHAIVSETLKRPRVHVVCVVNREERLIGLIDISRLADALFFSVFPEELLSGIKDLEQVLDYAQQAKTNCAEDLMREPVWVKMSDNLEKAFRLMHANKLSGLPIVDDHYHIVGYVNLLELMALCLDKGGEDEAAK